MKAKSKTDWKRLDALRDEEIDFSDIPPLGPAELSRMTLRLPVTKIAVSIRLDQDILEWFKARGEGYQTRINDALREFVRTPGNTPPAACVREEQAAYGTRSCEAPARVLTPEEYPAQSLRFTLRDDNGRHYHRRLPLRPEPFHIRLYWRASRGSPVLALGMCRLQLPQLLEEHLVRAETSAPGYVRVRFWRDDEGVVQLRAGMDGPGLPLWPLPPDIREKLGRAGG